MNRTSAAIQSLTPRELEILKMIAEGDSLPSIAQKLHRSLKTIETHRLSLGRKLNASNRVELAKIAIAEGLIQIEGTGEAGRPSTPITSQELDWLNQINDTVYNATGRAYLQRLCRALSTLPGIDFAAICTTDHTIKNGQGDMNRVVTACAERGEDLPSMRYHALSTPCHDVIKGGMCAVYKGVTSAYPDDPWLNQIHAESYLGMKLKTVEGGDVGGIALISRKEMTNMETLRRVVAFYTPRAAAMLQTCIEIEQLHSINTLQNHKLEEGAATQAEMEGVQRDANASALVHITRSVHPLTGIDFLHGLVNALCETFGTDYAGICQAIDSDDSAKLMAKSVIFRAKGTLNDPIAYALQGSPCEQTLANGELCVECGAASRYPEDDYFQKEKIESYVGVRLSNPAGQINGIIWMLDPRPLKDANSIQHVLRHFAPRIAAEIEQLKAYETLLLRQEKLEQKLRRFKDISSQR